jgi:hypothetical protein
MKNEFGTVEIDNAKVTTIQRFPVSVYSNIVKNGKYITFTIEIEVVQNWYGTTVGIDWAMACREYFDLKHEQQIAFKDTVMTNFRNQHPEFYN